MAVRLFVGNLPYSATEADLREHFAKVGPLTYVYLPTDRESGKPRGFAFVEFGERSHAEDAIRRFNNQPFQGRPISVSEARAKDDRAPSGPPRAQAPRSISPSEEALPAAGATGGRSFGPDAAPRGKRKQQKGGAKSERGPKGPIRERPGGQLYLSDDDDTYEDDLDGENFASRVTDSEDDFDA
jgi:RNA recognition motif-containing protein